MSLYILLRSVKYLRCIPKIMLRSSLVKINKPAPAEKLSMVNPSSSKKINRNPMSWKTMMILSLRRKWGEMATKEHKIKSVKAAAAEKGRTYGIDSLNPAETVHEADNGLI